MGQEGVPPSTGGGIRASHVVEEAVWMPLRSISSALLSLGVSPSFPHQIASSCTFAIVSAKDWDAVLTPVVHETMRGASSSSSSARWGRRRPLPLSVGSVRSCIRYQSTAPHMAEWAFLTRTGGRHRFCFLGTLSSGSPNTPVRVSLHDGKDDPHEEEEEEENASHHSNDAQEEAG